MNKTLNHGISGGFENKLTVNSDTLAEMLDCGRATAVKIGEAAQGKITIGRRVLFSVPKIQKYLEEIASKQAVR